MIGVLWVIRHVLVNLNVTIRRPSTPKRKQNLLLFRVDFFRDSHPQFLCHYVAKPELKVEKRLDSVLVENRVPPQSKPIL